MDEYPQVEKKRRKKKPGLCLLIVIGFFVVLFVIILLLQNLGSFLLSRMNSVAILPIEGAIYDVSDELEAVKKYRDTPGVKALVLQIDSPGGSVGAIQELYSELLKLRTESKKPIVASFGNISASGGYYLACAADEIVTNPGTITGSIGVIMAFPNWEELIRKVGIQLEVVKSGKFKDIGSPTRPMTPEEKTLLTGVIDDVYEQFFEAVYTARHLQVEKKMLSEKTQQISDKATTAGLAEEEVKTRLRELADGRIFSGRQALNYGLVDRLGTLEDAILRAGELGQIKGTPYVIKPKRRWRFWDLLSGKALALPHLPLYDSPRLEYRFVLE